MSLFLKRGFLWALCLLTLISFVACGDSQPNDTESTLSSETSSSEFEKPADYATVVLVSINPKLRLYLDADGKVLAVEAVNAEAKEIKTAVSFENKSYEAAVQEIIAKANEKGYIKSDAVINVEIVENKNASVDKSGILNKITNTVNQTASSLELTVEVKTADATDAVSSTESSADSSEATPSEPASCEHTYSDATCEAPKTCSKCGATEGKVLEHNYKDGACTYCKDKQPDYGTWTAMRVDGDSLYVISIAFNVNNGKDDFSFFEYRTVDSFSQEDRDAMASVGTPTISYNQKEYLQFGGMGDECVHKVSGNTVTVNTTENNKSLKLEKKGKNQLVLVSFTNYDNFGLEKNLVFEFEE